MVEIRGTAGTANEIPALHFRWKQRHCTPAESLVNNHAKTFWHAAEAGESGPQKLHKWAKPEAEGKNWLDKEIAR